MSKEETLLTRYGEMLDLIACMAIENGANQKIRRRLSFDEIFSLR